ncbi:hypothetical protein AVEN_63325-1 [Araneus ventricosus]|uniref:Uncharacterized protein n=1 Tax=Araneus ventricosus TaxID=182803 RepID=A0A4Y2VGR5_ARAVE|nr:hypothetical protein AVEN_63325-1 [Araneus ventricosus]
MTPLPLLSLTTIEKGRLQYGRSIHHGDQRAKSRTKVFPNHVTLMKPQMFSDESKTQYHFQNNHTGQRLGPFPFILITKSTSLRTWKLNVSSTIRIKKKSFCRMKWLNV